MIERVRKARTTYHDKDGREISREEYERLQNNPKSTETSEVERQRDGLPESEGDA